MSNTAKTSSNTTRPHTASKSTGLRGKSRLAGMLTAWGVIGVFSLMSANAARLPVASAAASTDDGNVPANTIDGSLSTRWSAEGDGQWISFDLGTSQTLGSVKIAWHNGNQRQSHFDVQTSGNGSTWTTVFSGQSSGTTAALENYATTEASARYVRILGHGNSATMWNSILEVELYSGNAGAPRPIGLKLVVDPALPTLKGTLNGTAVALQWDRVPGAVYQFQVSSNLTSWANLGAAFTNTAATQQWNEDTSNLSTATWPQRFYRVKRSAGPVTAPVANFLASSTLGIAPLTVTFTDQSVGSPAAWTWTFGDGTSSTAQNPSHLYSSPGSYTVTLAVRNSAGDTSTKTAAIVVTPQPTGGLPSGILNLTNWKLTLPVNTSHAGAPDEFLQPELNGYQNSDYFYVNNTRDGVVFTAHCGGYTTSGSGYPRSELREMTSNGSAQASWSTTSGTHTMEIRQAVTHLPVTKPHVVVGQIHDAGDDVIVFRLEGTKLFVDQNGVNGPVLTSNYKLGDVFTVKFVARNGGVECYYNGQYIYTYAVSTSGCYFKAGCYTQSNTSKGDAATAYGQVVIYNVSVTHQ